MTVSSMARYDGAPRARIFKRAAPKVTDWQSFKDLIRYNDFEHDPVTQTHGEAIAPPGTQTQHTTLVVLYELV